MLWLFVKRQIPYHEHTKQHPKIFLASAANNRHVRLQHCLLCWIVEEKCYPQKKRWIVGCSKDWVVDRGGEPAIEVSCRPYSL